MWQESEQVWQFVQCSIESTRGFRKGQLLASSKSFDTPLRNFWIHSFSSASSLGFGMLSRSVSSRLASYFSLASSESGVHAGSIDLSSRGGCMGIRSSLSTWIHWSVFLLTSSMRNFFLLSSRLIYR